MRIHREKRSIVLRLTLLEATVLAQILSQIAAIYARKPSELEGNAAAPWFAKRGCRSAGMSNEETDEWLAQLHEYKSARLGLIRSWIRALNKRKDEEIKLSLSRERSSEFVTVLNDQRLLTAARNEIGQTEMDASSTEEFAAMHPNQRSAWTEIHFLGCLIESVLHFLMAPVRPRRHKPPST